MHYESAGPKLYRGSAKLRKERDGLVSPGKAGFVSRNGKSLIIWQEKNQRSASSRASKSVLSSHLFWTPAYASLSMWAIQPGSHSRKARTEVCFFQALSSPPSAVLGLFLSSREGLSAPYPSSILKAKFVYPRHWRSPLLGMA